MAIDILPIHDILNYHFEIPNYQRGYRWDEEQVFGKTIKVNSNFHPQDMMKKRIFF